MTNTYTHTFCLNVSFWWIDGSNGMYLNFYVYYYKISLIYTATVCIFKLTCQYSCWVLSIVNPLTLSNLIRETSHLNVSCIYIFYCEVIMWVFPFFFPFLVSFLLSLLPLSYLSFPLETVMPLTHNNLSPELEMVPLYY